MVRSRLWPGHTCQTTDERPATAGTWRGRCSPSPSQFPRADIIGFHGRCGRSNAVESARRALHENEKVPCYPGLTGRWIGGKTVERIPDSTSVPAKGPWRPGPADESGEVIGSVSGRRCPRSRGRRVGAERPPDSCRGMHTRPGSEVHRVIRHTLTHCVCVFPRLPNTTQGPPQSAGRVTLACRRQCNATQQEPCPALAIALQPLSQGLRANLPRVGSTLHGVAGTSRKRA